MQVLGNFPSCSLSRLLVEMQSVGCCKARHIGLQGGHFCAKILILSHTSNFLIEKENDNKKMEKKVCDRPDKNYIVMNINIQQDPLS